MSHTYTPFSTLLLGVMSGWDVRVILVMTNTTADTEVDAEFVGSITTLDEMDGANYTRQQIATETVNENLASNRAEFDGGDTVFTNLGAGTRAVAGAILYRHVTNDADSPLLQYVNTGGFPYTANGATLTITWNAAGILQLLAAA